VIGKNPISWQNPVYKRGLPRMPNDQNQSTKFSRLVAELLLGGAAVAFLTWICFQLKLNIATTVPLYMIVVVLLSLRGRVVPAVLLSVIAAVFLA